MSLANLWRMLRADLHDHKAQLRFCLRITLAALLAYGLAQFWTFPLRGLWAVLTAIVVTQISIGASLQATTEYVVGTIGGAIYASAVALIVPHGTPVGLIGVLVLSVAPLALLAAFNSKFRVAPFTAVLVLFISNEYHQSPIESGAYRVLEVLIGGVSALLVSILVLPERAYARAIGAAAHILERFADVLPELLAGFRKMLDIESMHRLQDDLGISIMSFQAILAEVKRERLTSFSIESDHASLSRTLLRLRHDLVIIGRAAGAPLPEPFGAKLNPLLDRVASCTAKNLRDCSAALMARKLPPSLENLDAAYEVFSAEFAALRKEGFTRTLSEHEVERVFALGFALEQLHRDLGDLHRCVKELARVPKAKDI